MIQMRKRAQDGRRSLLNSSSSFSNSILFRDESDRNDEIQKLIARAEFNARQYMTNFNLSSLTSSTLVKIVPLSSSTKIS
jgi:hypothetical protein